MRRKLLVASVVLAGFFMGYGISAQAYYGQSPGQGYLSGSGNDTSGWEVMNVSCANSGEYGPYNYDNGNTWCNAIPRDLNTAAEYIAFIEGRLANGVPNGSHGFSSGTYGDPRARTAAAVVVHTMLGTPTGQRGSPPNGTQMNNWRTLVNTYAAQGRINWNTQAYTWTVNSLYQGTDNSPSPNDVTFYNGNRDGAAIIFTAPNGTIYSLRRECGNPMGGTSLPPLSDFRITGSTTVDNPTPLPDDLINFNYYIRNLGPTSTSPTTIWWAAIGSVAGAGGPYGVMNPSPDVLVYSEPYRVPAGTLAGTSICRQTGWDPVDDEGNRDGRGIPACAVVRYQYSLTPSVVVRVNGAVATDNIAEQGDTISFTYEVRNTGATQSHPVTCTYRQASYTGYSTAPPGTGFVPGGATCGSPPIPPAPPAQVFPASTPTPITAVATEGSVPAATGNTSICRSFTITPTTPGGGPLTAQGCAHVTTKPYTRVFGGDVVAGGGVETSPGGGSCTSTSNAGAAVIGWNRRDTPAGTGWPGAGAQFGVFAASTIFDFVAGLGNPAPGAGTASKPSHLAFSNNAVTAVNQTNGIFGGTFVSMPCIRDHYSYRPTSPAPPPTPPGARIADLTTGTYGNNSNTYFSGSGDISAGERITVYVDGDLYINSNVRYIGSGSWTSATIPSFRVIVRGNIFIDRGVVQLDGLYVAQQTTGNTKGNIYTCASTTTLPNMYTPLTLAGSLGSQCGTKLTVNGGFVAKQVWLLRTVGTLRGSTVAEGSGSANIAEVFNYNPALWIAQPTTTSGIADYDAINSLPPVL